MLDLYNLVHIDDTSPYGNNPIKWKSSIEDALLSMPTHISGYEYAFYLVLIEMTGFDVIIGMSWLSKYKERVDCHRKRVEFRVPNGKILKFEGERELPKQVNPMIVNFWEGEMDRVDVQYPRVVRKFHDVFP